MLFVVIVATVTVVVVVVVVAVVVVEVVEVVVVVVVILVVVVVAVVVVAVVVASIVVVAVTNDLADTTCPSVAIPRLAQDKYRKSSEDGHRSLASISSSLPRKGCNTCSWKSACRNKVTWEELW